MSKRLHFSHSGMVARTQLAVMDHNANLARPQASDRKGNLRYKCVFPKRTKEWVAKPIYQSKEHSWREDLLHACCAVLQGDLVLRPMEPIICPPNIASKPKPCKRELIASHVSRFAV
jgi:hypothetical protein